jgi:hypothetical protein
MRNRPHDIQNGPTRAHSSSPPIAHITRLVWYASNIELSVTNAFLPNWDPIWTRLNIVPLLVALRTAQGLRLVDAWVVTFLLPLSANAPSHVALLGWTRES